MRTGKADDGLVKVVLPARRQIWLWTPKNGGGSISRALVRRYGPDAIPCELTFEQLWRLNPAFEDFRIVAVKRNPFTRAVSCWMNKIMYPAEANESYFRRYAGLRRKMPFGEFAAWLNSEEGSDDKANTHWQSQHLQLERAKELISFEDLPNAVRALGLSPAELPHRNRFDESAEAAGVEPRPLVEWYDDEARRHIAERYARDLEMLGYDFPSEPEPASAPAAADA